MTNPPPTRRFDRRILAIAAAGLLLAAGWLAWWLARPVPVDKGDPARPPASAPAAPVVPGAQAPPSDGLARLRSAFATVYGSAAPVRRSIDGKAYEISPETLVPLGDLAALITRAEQIDACHACEGAIGIHYLRPRNAGFGVVGRWPLFVPGSSNGAATTGWSIRRDLGADPVIVSEGGFTGQGYHCSWANLAALTPAGPVARGLIRIAYSDSGAVAEEAQATEWEGRIVRPVPDRTFEVDYEGSERFTERYVLSGGRYQIVGRSRFEVHC